MDIIECIEQRRAINFFEEGVEVPTEQIERLLRVASLAPSSFNLQPWEVVVVTSGERKRALRRCAMDQPKVEQASAVLIIVADPRSVENNASRAIEDWKRLGYIKDDATATAYRQIMDSLYGSPDSTTRKVFAAKNAALFAMTLMLAARGMGLETHPMDGFDEEAVKREFNIARHKLVPMLVAIGRLKQGVELLPRAFRRGVDEFARFE